jgi:UDP-GlcNAc3NAcA epimerase
MKKHIATIVGARPQFIKAATLSRAFKENQKVRETLIHTGQHHDALMSDVFFDELRIPKPSYLLNIQGGSHGQMTGRMVEAIETTLLEENPDAALVYGDTNSTLAGALAASKLHIPVIHIEAGLRSYNRSMPEEINRVLTDHISTLLFCPTKVAGSNLAKEGIFQGVHHTGDVMYDATLFAINSIKDNKDLSRKFSHIPDHFGLLTIHRAESTQSLVHLQTILEYVGDISRQNNLQVIFPVHPRTRKLIEDGGIGKTISHNIQLIEPLSYFETQFLLTKAGCIFTDSGGLQKEAYFHRVPCITLRTETEWVETIEAGWNRLWSVKTYHDRKDIKDYGDGNAAGEISKIIMDNL